MDQDVDGDLDLIATDIIRPAETAQGLKVPVIYEMSPYYQSLGRGNESETKNEEDGDFVPEVFPLFYDNYFVPRGYAFIAQDMRGTRNSEGCMVLGGKEEALDAKATIAWLNGRGTAFDAAGNEVKADWSTGKVGMIGKSYDGSVANGAAALGIRGLETIVPIGAIDRWYDYHLNNGVQYINAYLTPGYFSFIIDQEPADDEERGAEWVEATYGENGPCSAIGASIVARAANPVGDYDDFWDHRDYLVDAEKVRASVFLVHGLNDWNVKPNNYVQWWDALARDGVERKIWLAQTGHVDPFDFRRAEWVETLHRWFDHELHGIDNGITDEPMADVEVEPGRWVREPTWPHEDARNVEVFLTGGGDRPGALTRSAPKASEASFTDDPFQGESSMISDPDEARTGRLAFLSPRLTEAVRLSGTVEVDIRARVDRPDTNLTALLVDYGADNRFPVSSEGSRTGRKETCWGASTRADDACYRETHVPVRKANVHIVSRGWLDARHHGSLRSNTPLIPGQTYRFRWEIFGDDHTFAPGHRLGIIIAGSDFGWTIPDPNHATVTVELGKTKVIFPVVGGSRRLGF